MKAILLKTIFVLSILILSSCKKDETVVTVKPSRDIYGVTILKNGVANVSNSNGIQVSVEGTSIYSLSDSAGNFKLQGVEYGEQCFVYKKSGYGTFKQYKIVGDSSDPFLLGVALFQLPPNKVANITAQFSNDSLIIMGSLSSIAEVYRGIIVFVSKDSLVSSDPSKYIFVKDNYDAPQDSINFTLSIKKTDLTSKGVNVGDKIYLVAYSSIDYGFNWREYFDKQTGKTSYNGISLFPSNIVGVRVP